MTDSPLSPDRCRFPVASPGFVARRSKAGNYVMGHSRWKFRAGCSSCSMTTSFVTNAVLIERAVSCWHLHQHISQTVGSQIYSKSELKMKLFEVEGGGARAPMPYSWRRHCRFLPSAQWTYLFRVRYEVDWRREVIDTAIDKLYSPCFACKTCKWHANSWRTCTF